MDMTDIQSINKKITALQKELDTMRGDEAELNRLHTEKAGALDAMRSGKSRDFAGMAALEGQRAALDTMLREQREEISAHEARLHDLEEQRHRAGQLDRVGALASRIAQARADLHSGLHGLVATLTPELERLIGLHGEWAALRAEWIETAREMGGTSFTPLGRTGISDDLLSELRERGVNVDALHYSRNFQPETTSDVTDPLPLQIVEPFSYAAFPERVETFTGTLFRDALHGWHVSRTDRARAHRGEL